MGAGFGFAGFAEGFAKAFTEAQREQRAAKSRKDEFLTEQLIKGALNDPKAATSSPEIMADLAKRLGPSGDVFTQFLKVHAQNVEGDEFGGLLQPLPQPGAAQGGQPAAAAPDATAALIGGMSPVQQPGVLEPPASPETVQQPTAPTAAPAAPGAISIPMPGPRTRAEAIQRDLGPGMERTIKGSKGGRLTLKGSEAQEAYAGQVWQQHLAAGEDTVAAAEATQQQLISEGRVPPKWITDLALASTKREIVAKEAAAREAATRRAKIAKPSSEAEFRAAAADGLVPGGFVMGRSPKDDDLGMAASQGLVISTLPDGTKVAVPRDYAASSGAMFVEPSKLLSDKVARKMATKQTTQSQNLKIVKGAIQELRNTNAFNLLVPAPKTLGGAIKGEFKAQTKNRAKLFLYRRQGSSTPNGMAAIALDNLSTLGTPFVKALGDVGAITLNDRQAFERVVGRIAAGVATREEAEARIAWLESVMAKIESDPGIAARLEAGDKFDHPVLSGAVGGDDAASTLTPSTTTTSTSLPRGARVVEEGGKRFVEIPD